MNSYKMTEESELSFFEQLKARLLPSFELVDNLNQLPPTYTLGDKFGYTQILPDPTTALLIQHHIDNANKAENDLKNAR